MAIKANVHTDDYVFDIEFDASPWFATANEQEILDLAECGWGGDYPADVVAEYFESSIEFAHGQVKRMFEYLNLISDTPKSCGFECHVDEKSARGWLTAFRPEIKIP